MSDAITITGNDLPVFQNLTVYQGATLQTVITWEQNGSPANLTGYSAALTIQQGTNTLLSLSTGNGGIVLGGTAGTITLTASATSTAALVPANGVYDLLLTSNSGTVSALMSGLASIRAGVTA